MKTNELFMKVKLLICCLVLSPMLAMHAQPYWETYIHNKYVNENIFLKQSIDTTTPPNFKTAVSQLPEPFWVARPDVIKCYWKTWEIAYSNLHPVEPKSGFVYPLLDAAFNGDIYMWDNSFMLMFLKYGIHSFNFLHTLNNFYCKQHPDGFICREIRRSDGTDTFERWAVASTGPNIMPWAEWEYYTNLNDTARLKQIFPVLLAYYQWFKANRSWPDGSYFANGQSCGMDNQPRIPGNENSQAVNHSTGHISWIDATLQQIIAGKALIEMGNIINRTADTRLLVTEVAYLTDYVNRNMYDSNSDYYFDRQRDGTLTGVKSIAAYWALLAGVVPSGKLKGFVAHLENSNEFDRPNRVPTLSADDPHYKPEWGYWLGGVWAPTNYMVLRGLTKYKQDSLAFEIAQNNLNNVVKVFNQKGTLYENYSPETGEGQYKDNFVGWTGLVPIAVLFEYVFGIRTNVPENTLVWDIRLTDAFGIKKYPFGRTGLLNLQCDKRKKSTDKPVISIESNVDFKLLLKWKGGIQVVNIKKKSKTNRN